MKKKKDEITIRSSTAEYFERLLERIREIRFFEACCHYLPTAITGVFTFAFFFASFSIASHNPQR